MIYNLAQYIDTNTTLSINVNGFQPTAPNDVVSINEGPGDERPWFDRVDTVVQVLSRAKERPVARENCYTVYDLIKKRYDLVLPAATVNSIVYPALTAWGIRPVNPPQYAYDDDNGRPVFSFSVEITTT